MASKFRNLRNFRHLSSVSSNIPKARALPSSIELSNPGQDVASYVRFNRNIVSPQLSDYVELLEPVRNDEHQLALLKAKIHLICCEFDYHCRLNMRVPAEITVEQMKELLKCGSPESRQSWLTKLYTRDSLKIRQHVRKTIKQENREASSTEFSTKFRQGCFDYDGQLQYGLWKNCMSIRITDFPSLKINSAIRSKLYSPKLIIDWRFPVKIMEDSCLNALDSQSSEDVMLTNPPLRNHFRRYFIQQMYELCNYNLKCHNRAFDIVHYQLDDSNPFKKPLLDKFSLSSIDYRFFETIDKLPESCEIRYITPLAETLLDTSQTWNPYTACHSQESSPAVHFMISPYSELYQLRLEVIRELNRRNSENMPSNVKFYRWPTDGYLRSQHHIVLGHYINCLRDVHFDQSSWIDSFRRHLARKYFIVNTVNEENQL